DFSEEDKAALRDVELEILNLVVPTYRALADRGQVELSTSPFYHPILPLLCDTDVYLRTHPASRTPRPRFVHPEDAAGQLARGAQRRGRRGHPDNPGRRERVGAFRGRRTAVPTGPVQPAGGAFRAADRHDGGGMRGPDAGDREHLPRVLDRRQLLYLDRPSR